MAFGGKSSIVVSITGAAGQIGYSLVPMIARGLMLGANQRLSLRLLDIEPAMKSLGGLKMELEDCAFALLDEVVVTFDAKEAFTGADVVIMCGAFPRKPGMERKDLLEINAKIFKEQGGLLKSVASPDVRVLVVGNPANTNALIAAHYAKDLPSTSFTAMTRLDHNRALTQLAQKTNSHIDEIKHMCIWGNHSPTMYADVNHATIKGKKVTELVDQKWIDTDFIPTVQQRGAAVIKARKLSSAASAGNAAIDHMRTWAHGTNGEWTSMGIPTDGSYGIPKGLVYSFPVTVKDGKYSIVQGLKISPEAQRRMDITRDELLQERAAIEHLLK